MKKSIYQQIKETGVEISNHYSDLYVPQNKTTLPIIAAYRKEGHTVEVFRNNIDGKNWYDIPFAYEPYWEMVANKKI